MRAQQKTGWKHSAPTNARRTDREMGMRGLIEDLLDRVNPAYAETPGTESYERMRCVRELESLKNEVLALKSDRDHLRGLILNVFAHLHKSDRNGPGHDHKTRGFWDDGRPCKWCSLWDDVKIEAMK